MKILGVGITAAATLALAAPAAAAGAADSVGGWSSPALVGDHTGSTYPGSPGAVWAENPVVATAATGASVAAWTGEAQRAGTATYALYAATKAPGGAWTRARLITSDDRNGNGSIYVGMRRNGAATVVWTRHADTGLDTVLYAFHRPGHGWGPAREVPGQAGTRVDSFRMAPNGYGVLGFNRLRTVGANRTPTYLGYVRKLAPDGQWHAPIRVTSTVPPAPSDGQKRNLGADDVQAAIDTTGTVTVMWSWVTASTPGGQTRRAEWTTVGAGGTAGAVATVSPAAYETRAPAMSPAGGAALAWLSDLGKALTVRFRAAGGSWHQHTITPAAGLVEDVAVAVRDSGPTVFWVVDPAANTPDATGTTITLYSSTYSAIGGWSAPVTLDSHTATDAHGWSLNGLGAAASSGSVYLAWAAVDNTAFLGGGLASTASVATIAPDGAVTTRSQPLGTSPGAVAAGGTHATFAYLQQHAADTPADLYALSR